MTPDGITLFDEPVRFPYHAQRVPSVSIAHVPL